MFAIGNINKIRICIVMSFFILSIGNNLFAQEQSGALPTRDKIDEKYKWNLNDVYESETLWEDDFNSVESNLEKLAEFHGKLGFSASIFYECLSFSDELSIKAERLYLYASLAKDLDLADSKYQSLYDRISVLYSNLSAACSFMRPEILDLGEAKIKEFIVKEPRLKVYEHVFSNILRQKEHTLTPNEERLMALASQSTQTPENVFRIFSNADIQLPMIEDEQGQLMQMSHGRFYAALYSTDRDYRERAYKAYYKPFIDYKNTYAALLMGNVKGNIFNAKARKYNSCREASLDGNNIPESVYDNLVKSVNDNLKPLQRWAEIKKRILGVEKLHNYDLYVTLFPGVSKKYSYDEGVELTLEALEPLGEKYINDLKIAYNNRWVDVYETKGKRSGAYSSGSTYGVHPFVLLNWTDQLNDVFTLAHEMGHNMHSYYTANEQPYPYANYSIFLAEVASTFNEALLLDYLIENADSKEEKLSLIEKYLTNITTTFYRQTMFAEFEQEIHERMEHGESLTAESLSELYKNITIKYWGEALSINEEEAYTWARIPHFYYNFYVFQYATGYAASQALVEKVKNEGNAAVEVYINKFLKAGSSKYSLDILTDAGVDMNSPKPVLATAKKMNELLDQMESLLNE